MIGPKIKELRKENNQSMQMVANGVGCTKSNICLIENEEIKKPSLEIVKNLAEHFGVTISYLLGEEIEKGDSEIKAICNNLKRLEKRDFELIKSILRKMLSK